VDVWKKRWVVLMLDGVSYYKTEEDYKAGKVMRSLVVSINAVVSVLARVGKRLVEIGGCSAWCGIRCCIGSTSLETSHE